MLAGNNGNCTIRVGSTEESTLTVGAMCPVVSNVGTRKGGGTVGKLSLPLFPLLVAVAAGVGLGVPANGLAQALNNSVSSTITSNVVTPLVGVRARSDDLCLNIVCFSFWLGCAINHRTGAVW